MILKTLEDVRSEFTPDEFDQFINSIYDNLHYSLEDISSYSELTDREKEVISRELLDKIKVD